jgi:iron complex transport system ATP-binding protein
LSIQLADQVILFNDNMVLSDTPTNLINENAFDNLFPKEMVTFNKNLQQFIINKK